MTSTHLTDDTLEITFTGWEKLLGVVRDLAIPLTAVAQVDVVPDGYAAARGLRAPGMSIPGRRKLGTWRQRGSKQLVAVQSGQPALRITVTDQRYTELLLGADDADSLAAGLVAASR